MEEAEREGKGRRMGQRIGNTSLGVGPAEPGTPPREGVLRHAAGADPRVHPNFRGAANPGP